MADRTTKVTLTAQVSGYIAGMEKAAAATKATGSEAQKLGQQKESIATLGRSLLAVGAVAAAGVGLAIAKFAEFDAKMSQVKTLSHATSGEMEQLSNAALNMGQSIGYSASQVADAEIELVKAGISVKDIMGGALKGALDLAAAGQIDVAEATSIASSAMVQFGLKGKDVPHIADLLAAGADKALGGVSDLGQALKYAGPVAASFGVSLDETVGTLSEFAQNGILADQAGTGLRGVLSSLTSPSTQANKILTQYKINLFDAAGKFIGLAGAAGQLHDKLGPLTQQERSFALGQIFGNQQITVANILMKDGAKGIKDWTKAVNDQGFASQQARGKMDNLAGDVKKLSAAFGSDLIKSGSAANGALRGVVQSVTGLATAFGHLSGPAQGAVLVVGALVAAIGLLGGGALLAVPKLAAFKVALTELGTSMKTVSLSGGAIGIAIAGLVEILGQFGAAQAEIDGDAQSLSDTLDQQTGAITKNSKAFVANKLAKDGTLAAGAKVGLQGKDIVDAYLQQGSAITKVNKVLAQLGDTNSKFYKGQQAGKVSAEDLIAANKKLQDLIGKGKVTYDQAKGVTDALAGAQDDATDKTEKATSAVDELAGATQKAAQSTDDYNKALQNLGKVNLDAAEANIAYNQSLQDASDATKQVGQSLDITTEAGRKNMSALDNIASRAVNLVASQQAANASTDQLTATMASARQAFIEQAIKMGANAQKANELADQLGLIPGDVSTAFHTTGADAAQLAAENIKRAMDAIDRDFTINVRFAQQGSPPPTRLVTGFADGGLLPGVPSAKDNMLIHAASGEFVTNSASASIPSNRAMLEYINRGGVVRGYANGGQVASSYVPAPAYTGPSSGTPGPVHLSLAGASITATLDGQPIKLMIHDQIVTAQHSNDRAAERGYRG